MARLKLPGFALLCVALGFWGLYYLSGRTAELASKQTAERLAWGQVLFETSGRLARGYQSSALAAAAADPALAQALAASKDHDLSPAVAAAAQKAVAAAFEKLPAALRSPQQILIGTPRAVSALTTGSGEAQVLDKGAYDLAGAAQANAAAHALVDGRLYRVVAAAVHGPNGSALGYLGATVAMDDAFAAEQARDLTMDVTVLGGRSVASSLPTVMRAKVAAAPDGPVELERRKSLGFPLPIFADGASPQVDKSFVLEGATGARVVLTSTSLPLEGLADFQQKALLFLAGLALVGLALTLLPEPTSEGAEEARFGRIPSRREISPPARAASSPSAAGAAAPEPAPPPLAIPEPPAAVGSPDDFPFGDSLRPARQSTPAPSIPAAPPPAQEAGFEAEPLKGSPASDLPAEPALSPLPEPPVAPEPLPPAGFGASFFGQEPSVPLPAPSPQQPPAAAAPPLPPLGPIPYGVPKDKPFDLFGLAPAAVAEAAADAIEKTAVSTVPEHLLRATRWPTPRAPLGSAESPVPLPAPPTVALSPDEGHFQDVYQQFLAVRTQCNQAADGLTYDKFAAKLRKNKEQLVQKYSCRTVRFQVYVKDGKAALKASPVKD